ncbi:hypothetical protein NPIL_149421 [Nephila pilipes]|uniref:Uncharacterized protein n=1 Tax=Nephila pilipes TaxID=299642 RepID=A0A8X6PDV4_NEPPI|nr:hypothetical protein NPIL_149421 [Nephila pilipes]
MCVFDDTCKLNLSLFLFNLPADIHATFLVMAGKDKIFNMKDPNDFETIRNILLCDSDDDNIVLDESDTDEKKSTFQKEKMLESE